MASLYRPPYTEGGLIILNNRKKIPVSIISGNGFLLTKNKKTVPLQVLCSSGPSFPCGREALFRDRIGRPFFCGIIRAEKKIDIPVNAGRIKIIPHK